FEAVPVSSVRRSIAENLTKVASIPQVTTFRELDCSSLERFRETLEVSPLPVVVRALAEVAADHPWINASWAGDEIRLHRTVHAAIATDTEAGLVVPVVRDVRSMGIAALAAEIARLAEGARAGTLPLADVTGATIAVSNTGSYGSESGTPLLNPGHAVTIALGAIAPRPLVVDGRIQAAPACTLSLTFDHRVLDGATVGRALGALVDLLESPERLERLPR
ncbi:MAG: 2-oxo acid dehydrogenase subunit E2, partial [Actinomycetota bacterium]